MIRAGEGEPVVLLHGVLGSERMWSRVVPLLAQRHDAIAITALGHRGGRPPTAGARIGDIVDDAERTLDELGLGRPHLAGNSMGGWVALELARRGRARSVCALSPAGCWDVSAAGQLHPTRTLRRVVSLVERTRPVLPLAVRVGFVRALALRDSAVHGGRLDPREVVELADDLLGCAVRGDLLGTHDQLAPMDPLPCPVLLAWSAKDRVFPPDVYGAHARRLFPGAEWRLLGGVGHVPMLDDPALVAGTILDAVSSAAGTR